MDLKLKNFIKHLSLRFILIDSSQFPDLDFLDLKFMRGDFKFDVVINQQIINIRRRKKRTEF